MSDEIQLTEPRDFNLAMLRWRAEAEEDAAREARCGDERVYVMDAPEQQC